MGLKTGLARCLGSGQGFGILLFGDGVSGIEDTMVRLIRIIDAGELGVANYTVLFTWNVVHRLVISNRLYCNV